MSRICEYSTYSLDIAKKLTLWRIKEMLTKQEKQAIMKEYATKEGDTGSPEVQIAVLTADINKLNVTSNNIQKINTQIEVY